MSGLSVLKTSCNSSKDILELVVDFQRERIKKRDRGEKILGELALMFMEAGKSHNRPFKAGDLEYQWPCSVQKG